MRLAGLLELNTGIPFSLTAEDFEGTPPDHFLSVLQSRVAELTPEVDPETIERIVIQYELQVRTQHAYGLTPYDGPVFLVEPQTSYLGLLEAQFRPYVRDLHTRAIKLNPPNSHTREIIKPFGSLEAHYRCMRDTGFVEVLAKELSAILD